MPANLGRAGEELVQMANRVYRDRGIAVVWKVPTRFVPKRTIVAGSYKVAGAFPAEKATVDFLGVWQGRAIAFDVKECRSARWSLGRLADHQRLFLRDWAASGGLAFVLLWFTGPSLMAGPSSPSEASRGDIVLLDICRICAWLDAGIRSIACGDVMPATAATGLYVPATVRTACDYALLLPYLAAASTVSA